MQINGNDADIFQYEAYRDISGAVQTVTLCRRNGRTAACFGPSFFPSSLFDGPEPEPPGPPEEVFANLTEKEASTWERILDGASLPDIAEEQGVTRTAIYERIRGNSKGHGGMIAKNHWVQLWWTLRKEFSSDDQLL